MTLQEAKAIGKAHGFTLRHKDGEYRVNVVGGTEAQAYYTTDRHDAVDTGIAQAKYQAAALGCKYFLRCTNRATTTIAHPTLGAVPACERCADFYKGGA